MINKTKQFLSSQYYSYLRVWRLLRKPTMSEFKTISKVTAVGLLIIGTLGFLIQLIMTFIPNA